MLLSSSASTLITSEKEHGCTRRPSLQARRSHSRSAPVWFARRASTAPGTAASTSAAAASASRSGLLIGAGAMYDLSRNVFARAGWDRYAQIGSDDTGKGHADVYSIGVGYRF